MRIKGKVITVHPNSGKYGGTFGEILGDDGEYYIYSSSHVFRNFSQAKIGAVVTFEVVKHNYATNIDQMDKHRRKPIMPTYHVTYFYLATGMEGIPDERDYGIIEAESKKAAIDLAVEAQHPTASTSTKDWVKGCLTAKEVKL